MAFAASKKYINESQIFKGKLPLAKVRREEFTPEEYRKLHTFARGWVKKARTPSQAWYRTVTYNFILIMCNTGMRPPEARNLRWRDVSIRNDDQERKFVVLHVRGKDKFRQLVAAAQCRGLLERIREIAKATEPDDFVFTTAEGKTTATITIDRQAFEGIGLVPVIGQAPIDLLLPATYATFRLTEGVDVYSSEADGHSADDETLRPHQPGQEAERTQGARMGADLRRAQVVAETGRVNAPLLARACSPTKPQVPASATKREDTIMNTTTNARATKSMR